ncbi:MAG: DUF5005 domain-containing protein [Treponema sp.]|nr:DUF5005 domain-containing protein [Treponema sp.]
MSKNNFKLIFIVLLVFVISGCEGPPPTIDTNTPWTGSPLPNTQTGDVIRLTAVFSAHTPIVNNSGMSGAPLGRVHSHSAFPADMYSGGKQDFIFDAGRIDQFGELHIWNHNGGSGGDGLKDITVSYSYDNETYTELGEYTLRRSPGAGRLSVTNLQDDSYIDFKGAAGRYIKISPDTNHGGGQWGLSEIRLFRFRPPVQQGGYIAAAPINNIHSLPAAGLSNLTSGAGLSHPTSDTAVHNNNAAHMYSVSGSSGTFDIDLHGRYPIQKVVIWNYNGAGNTNRGLQTVTIRTSDGPQGTQSLGTDWDWNQRASGQPITAGTGNNNMPPSATIQMNNHTARFIRITGNAISGNQTGLSAVRVYMGEGYYADYVHDWSALLSVYPHPNTYTNGWAGADGTFTVNLDGRDFDPARNPRNRRTLFTFQDTLISRVNAVTGERIGWGMPNNTMGILNGEPYAANVNFSDTTFITPPAPNNPRRYYWIGDNFIIGNKLYVICGRIGNTPGGGDWGFFDDQTDLAVLDIVNGNINRNSIKIYTDNGPVRYLYNETAPVGTNGRQTWSIGNAVMENTAAAGALNPDGYIYLYGVANNNGRNLIVARVKEEHVETFSEYEYLYNDDVWRKQPWGTSVTDQKYLNPSSERNFAGECSVHEMKWGPDKGKFYHVYMDTRYFERWLKIMVSDNPWGPFTDSRQIFHAVDPFFQIPTDGQSGMYSYNGKAHPAISPEGELYISYNVNGGNGGKYADIYRSRFIRYAQVPAGGN